MFWGCFGNSIVGDLKKITGIMTSDVYHQVPVHYAFPSGARIFNDNNTWYFMQDNDPKHTTKKVQSYLQSKQAAKNSKIRIMDWPSQSPDLNPLELLWEECDRQVKKRKPSSLSELEQVVKDVWVNMDPVKMNKLVARLPALCQANAGKGK